MLTVSRIAIISYHVKSCVRVTTAVTSFTNAAFGEGTGPIWMSNLTCVFNENSLFSCSRQVQIGWVQNTTTCSHSNDVAVRCSLRNGNLNPFPFTQAEVNFYD